MVLTADMICPAEQEQRKNKLGSEPLTAGVVATMKQDMRAKARYHMRTGMPHTCALLETRATHMRKPSCFGIPAIVESTDRSIAARRQHTKLTLHKMAKRNQKAAFPENGTVSIKPNGTLWFHRYGRLPVSQTCVRSAIWTRFSVVEWAPKIAHKCGATIGADRIPEPAPKSSPETGSKSGGAQASTNSCWTASRAQIQVHFPTPKMGAA